MLNRWQRSLSVLASLAGLVLWINLVPGVQQPEGLRFSVAKMLWLLFEPALVLVFVGVGLLVGGPKAFGTALLASLGGRAPGDRLSRLRPQRALLASSRALLWSSLVLSAACTLYSLRLDPMAGKLLWLDAGARLEILQTGGYFALPLFLIVLLPCLWRLDPKQAQARSFGGAMDLSVLLGHGLALLAFPLTILVARHEVVGQPGSAVRFLPPTFGQVDLALVGWSLGFVLSMTGLVWFFQSGRASDPRGSTQASPLRLTLLASGVVGCAVLRAAGLQYIATSGGAANSADVQALGGRMLVPIALALLLSGLQAGLGRLPVMRRTLATE